MNTLRIDLRKEFDTKEVSFELGYKYFVFKGGEPHFTLIDDNTLYSADRIFINTRITSFNDFGKLAVAVDAIRRALVEVENTKAVLELQLLYFPGARQDRVANFGEALTVKVYADLINNMKFERVTVLDAHSEVTTALINNCKPVNNHFFVRVVINSMMAHYNLENFTLISPDAGANKKIISLSKELNTRSNMPPFKIVYADKVRDTKTGELTDFKVHSNDLDGETCIIVDDICDGGGTFLGLAAELKKLGAAKIYLVVSHGIFSNGFKHLNEAFDAIYTTNSFADYDETWLEAYKYHHGFTPKLHSITLG